MDPLTMDTSAPVEQPAKVFKCEEHGEYVVIEARANTDQQADSKLVTEPHCKTEGQHCSPRPRVEGLDDSPEQEDYEEEWCVVAEQEKVRPRGLYGYRYVDYDDEEAEGNIHITDEHL